MSGPALRYGRSMTRRYAGFVTMGLGVAAVLLAAVATRFAVNGNLLFGVGIVAFIAGFFLAF